MSSRLLSASRIVVAMIRIAGRTRSALFTVRQGRALQIECGTRDSADLFPPLIGRRAQEEASGPVFGERMRPALRPCQAEDDSTQLDAMAPTKFRTMWRIASS